MSASSVNPRYFEDYEEGTSRETLGRTITEADIVRHAGETGDFYPHHMDEEWCQKEGFDTRIAHGTLIFSVAIGMAAHEINPRAMSYGYDRLRFINPVYIGDTISVTVEITEKRNEPDRPNHGIVVEACEVYNQEDQIVLACEHLLLVETRSS